MSDVDDPDVHNCELFRVIQSGPEVVKYSQRNRLSGNDNLVI